MNIQDSYKLTEMRKQYNVSMIDLVDTYTMLQTRYLRRDLEAKKPVNDLIGCNSYGNQAIKVMERYLKMKK